MTATESRGRARRELTELASRLATEGHWLEAIDINLQILERHPREVAAFNRLGKAYIELHRYASAFDAYRNALTIDPANPIAQRNLIRLRDRQEVEEDGYEPQSGNVRSLWFIQEVGRTYVDELVNVAPLPDLQLMRSGEELQFAVSGADVHVATPQGVYVGQLESRIAKRLIELISLGNTYRIVLIGVEAPPEGSVSWPRVRIIIREEGRGPEMGTRLSFPRQGKVSMPRTIAAVESDTRGSLEYAFDDEEDDTDVDDTDDDDSSDSDDEGDLPFAEDAPAVAADDEDDSI